MTDQVNEQEYILFSRDISPESVKDLVNLTMSFAPQCKEIYLLLHSNGGNVSAGIFCYNMLRALPCNLITHNVGNVDSIANVVFLAGDKRYTAPSATFMFHSVGFTINGPFRLQETNLREHLDSIVADHNRIGSIMADRSLITIEESSKLFEMQSVRGADWGR